MNMSNGAHAAHIVVIEIGRRNIAPVPLLARAGTLDGAVVAEETFDLGILANLTIERLERAR